AKEPVEVTAIEGTTWDVLRRVGGDRGQIDVQRRKDLLQMVGAVVEILRIGVCVDRVRYVLRKSCDKFNVRDPHWTCATRPPSTRHQLADCCTNSLSLSHG